MRRVVMMMALMLGLVSSVARGQQADPIVVGQWETVHSAILDEDRIVLVAVPAGYDPSSAKYPVIYLLDGRGNFAHTLGTMTHLTDNGRMPPAILVGIANTDRTRDLTPPTDNEAILQERPTAGGGDRFLAFLTRELIPHVENRYATAPYRVLIGHSLGGLFTTWTMVESPDTFNAHIAISPSLQWDDGKVIEQARTFFEDPKPEERFIFTTLGTEGPGITEAFGTFNTLLHDKAPESLTHGAMQLPDEDHGSVTLLSTYHGLKGLFSEWNAARVFATGDFAAIKAHFKMLSERYGYEIVPPEFPLNMLGYAHLQAGEHEQALEVFQYNARIHARSANVFDSLGECLETMGRLDEALRNYARAVGIGMATGDPSLPVYERNHERVKAMLDDLM